MRIVAPGDPFRSVLFYRMAKFGRGRMPHLGSEFPHQQGLNVIAQWIASLSNPPRAWDVQRITFANADKPFGSSFREAWPYARSFGFYNANEDKVLATATKLPPGPVRDLFDGYLPVAPGRHSSARTRGPRRFSR